VGVSVLLAICSNPPLTTSGERTRARVEQARTLLEFQDVRLANLFALPTYRTNDVETLGQGPDGWRRARVAIDEALDSADAVLLAYGVSAPAGLARKHHRDQVDWLDEAVSRRRLPAFWVGGAPRHPSRWQRYTFRQYPGMAYADGLKQALERRLW
jgi:hypothetical protein